mmetsp:Transcript_25386/g.47301  ORF Transcript_25386/g.47301 Transcript_25386/m.47301 type:complete len:122 (+) Transcript_25386:152-517(+)
MFLCVSCIQADLAQGSFAQQPPLPLSSMSTKKNRRPSKNSSSVVSFCSSPQGKVEAVVLENEVLPLTSIVVTVDVIGTKRDDDEGGTGGNNAFCKSSEREHEAEGIRDDGGKCSDDLESQR